MRGNSGGCQAPDYLQHAPGDHHAHQRGARARRRALRPRSAAAPAAPRAGAARARQSAAALRPAAPARAGGRRAPSTPMFAWARERLRVLTAPTAGRRAVREYQRLRDAPAPSATRRAQRYGLALAQIAQRPARRGRGRRCRRSRRRTRTTCSSASRWPRTPSRRRATTRWRASATRSCCAATRTTAR